MVGAPTLGSQAQSAAICRDSPLPAVNMLNEATRTMNSVPWQRVRAVATRRASVERRDFLISLPVSLSAGCQTEHIFHPSVSATHARRCRLILSESMENIPDCNGSHLVILTPHLPSLSTPQFPHRRHLEPIGGRVTPSHKALKGSQTH